MQIWLLPNLTTMLKTTRQPNISFVIENYRQSIVATKDSENWFSLYADWLRSIIILMLLTYFRKTNSMPIVITGACTVVTKMDPQVLWGTSRVVKKEPWGKVNSTLVWVREFSTIKLYCDTEFNLFSKIAATIAAFLKHSLKHISLGHC